MTITRCQSGGHSLKVNCNYFQIKEVALFVIDGYERLFTFKQLSDDVCQKLDERKCFDKEMGVICNGVFKFNRENSDTLQMIVWEQIWEHRLIIDLLNDSCDYSIDRESVRLLKVKRNEE